jgi:hypothetical protein
MNPITNVSSNHTLGNESLIFFFFFKKSPITNVTNESFANVLVDDTLGMRNFIFFFFKKSPITNVSCNNTLGNESPFTNVSKNHYVRK